MNDIPPDGRLAALLREPALRAALAAVAAEDAATLADMRAVTAIPAPWRGEAARAAWLADRLAAAGVPHVRMDAAGNVLAGAPAGHEDAAIMLAAHLDTVFPADVDVRVRDCGDRLCAPGIGDNSRGIAALVRTAAVLQRHPLPTRTVLYAGTVGEEGAGDLHGVKHLFEAQALRPRAFIAVDGAGLERVVHRAVGSRRLRVSVTGPGGHSWADRERPNPVHALAGALAALETERRSLGPASALHTGRIGGGTSVNAIPERAWLELDLRSEDPAEVARLEARARAAFEAAVPPPLRLTIECMGDRPGGATPASDPLVRAAAAATAHLGVEPELVSGSTDANVPMARGVPAISLGAGGTAAGMHTLEEWYCNERGAAGIQRLLLTLALLDSLR